MQRRSHKSPGEVPELTAEKTTIPHVLRKRHAVLLLQKGVSRSLPGYIKNAKRNISTRELPYSDKPEKTKEKSLGRPKQYRPGQ